MNSSSDLPNPHQWCAVVFGEHRTAMFDIRGQRRVWQYVPPGIMSDPVWLLDHTAALFERSGPDRHAEGAMIVKHVPLYEWGTDQRPVERQLVEFMTRAREGGWESTDAALRHKSGWVTFSQHGKPTVHMGVLEAMDPERCELFDVSWPAEDMAEQLARYTNATGAVWRSTAGVAGLSMLRRWYTTRVLPGGKQGGQPRWQWSEYSWDKVPIDPGPPGDLVWRRLMTAAERRRGYVHAFDINGQYLAAAAAAELGWDAPVPVGSYPFDPERPGYWRIVARASIKYGRGLPDTLNPTKIHSNGTAWVTTPMLAYLHERKIYPEVIDSWLSNRRARILRPWAERLRDGLTFNGRPDGHPDGCNCPQCRLRNALKATYTQAIGLMGASSAMVVRPDWADTIRDLARINLLRKLYGAFDQHGYMPLRVYRDCVWYADDEPNPAVLGAALGMIPGRMGKFKIEGTWPMAEYLAHEAERERKRKERRGQRDARS